MSVPTGAGPRTAPRVVMVVNNGVDGDSRVQKVAASAAEAGWDVVLVGVRPGAAGEPPTRLRLGEAQVLLVPLPPVVSGFERGRAGRPPAPARRAWRAALADIRALDAEEAAARPGCPAGSRARRSVVARWHRRLLDGGAGARRVDAVLTLLGTGPVGGRLAVALATARALLDHDGGWRQLNAFGADLEAALGPVVVALRPDLVHAHDAHTIGLVARAAARLRAGGHPVRWVYDAHEYVAGQGPEPVAGWGRAELRARLRRARLAVRHRYAVGAEREYAALADAVVTVSDPIADRLHTGLGLAARPVVVRNVPPAPPDGARAPSLRAAAGVPAGVPLLVYSGSCAPQRGVRTAVEALAHLPGVHLALVAAATDPHVAGLAALAARAGTADRLHVVGYVPADQVPEYLAEADAGLSPLLHRPNHELSLNTKYAEYLHARLPVLTSDVAYAAAWTREHGIGEVFVAGDVRSLAAAARLVLAEPDRYRARYRPDLLAEQSWQHQAGLLTELYARLLGGRPPARPQSAGGPAPLRLEPAGAVTAD